MTRSGLVFIMILFLFTPSGFLKGSDNKNDKKSNGDMKTVSDVDLTRYKGLWYEIAKIPNRFQKKCARDTMAEYKLRPDGRIDVINRCINKKGKEVVARGIGKVVDPATNSKLKVSFVRVLGIQLFWGDYWIIGLEKNYGYAVVGDSKRKYGWILCRKNHLSSEEWQEVEIILTDHGYDPKHFVKTEHTQKK